MTDKTYKPKKRRVAKFLQKIGWHYDVPANSLRHRIYDLSAIHGKPWYDWGARLMILTGSDFGGNWSEPEPATWYYRIGTPKRMFLTNYPRNYLSTIEVIKDYDEFRIRTEGLNDDEMYEWKAICINQDGDLLFGKQYWGGRFYGLNRWEQPLVRKYLKYAARHNWYGLRTWLYDLGLYATVNRKKPFSCKAVPPKNSGGYSHWFCQLKKNHKEDHKFNNYTWVDEGELKFNG